MQRTFVMWVMEKDILDFGLFSLVILIWYPWSAGLARKTAHATVPLSIASRNKQWCRMKIFPVWLFGFLRLLVPTGNNHGRHSQVQRTKNPGGEWSEQSGQHHPLTHPLYPGREAEKMSQKSGKTATTFINVFDPEKGKIFSKKRIAPVYFEVDYPFLRSFLWKCNALKSFVTICRWLAKIIPF